MHVDAEGLEYIFMLLIFEVIRCYIMFVITRKCASSNGRTKRDYVNVFVLFSSTIILKHNCFKIQRVEKNDVV